MKKVGLYFGSFNPIHLGHLIIAEHIVEYLSPEEVWFVVSPINPFKVNQTLAGENHRAAMVGLAIKNNPRLKLSTIEFELPKPSYTVNTLRLLREKYPDVSFEIIMGEDNIINLTKWKDYKAILDNYPIYVYPRMNREGHYQKLKITHLPKEIQGGKITLVDAPIMELSSTAIRKAITRNRSVKYQVSKEVVDYIHKHRLYLNNQKDIKQSNG